MSNSESDKQGILSQEDMQLDKQTAERFGNQAIHNLTEAEADAIDAAKDDDDE